MSEPIAVNRSNPFLNVACAVGVAGLAAGGFTLSFAALRDLAIASGIDADLAFIWPLIADGFIIVATGAAYVLGRRGRRVVWYPWAALVLFSAVSVAGNALHASKAEISVPLAVATAVSAVPAIALLIASHLLVVMVSGEGRTQPRKRAAVARRQQKNAETVTPAAEYPVTRIEEELRATTADEARVSVTVKNAAKAQLADRVRSAYAAGEHVTGAQAADWAGVPLTTGKRWLNEVRKALDLEKASELTGAGS